MSQPQARLLHHSSKQDTVLSCTFFGRLSLSSTPPQPCSSAFLSHSAEAMRDFDDLPTLGRPSSSHSPRRNTRGWVKRCERCCMSCLTGTPLVFVYGLTSWACWVQATLGFLELPGSWSGIHHTSPTTAARLTLHAKGRWSAVLGIILFGLLNWSYTTAVFTDPGSPLNTTNSYSALPSEDYPAASSFTVKSTGEMRFCKKCNTRKPDRAHHCSSCRRCVLKMDHHCPWLATCVGLRNYKAFLLFLIYTCVFCYHCFLVTAGWVWGEIMGTSPFGEDLRLMPINFILLSVLAGIFGLVLTGFTGWHIYLAVSGQTTIESLERNRYISPLRRNIQAHLQPQQQPDSSLGEHIRQIHANAIPGVTRLEEGEDQHQNGQSSPAQAALRSSYADLERARENDRYSSYLDELDSAKLPNAFDLGACANLRAVFGPSMPLWFLPVCNSIGDGWRWQPSPRWLAAREDLARAREAAAAASARPSARPAWDRGRGVPAYAMQDMGPPSGPSPRRSPQRPTRGSGDAESSDDDEGVAGARGDPSKRRLLGEQARPASAMQWNDLPEDMLHAPPSRGPSRSGARPRSPRHARAYPDQ